MAQQIDTTNNNLYKFWQSRREQVLDFCTPLKEYLGVSYVAYIRGFPGSSYTGLSTGNKKFADGYLKNVKKVDPYFIPYLTEAAVNKPNLCLWPDNPEQWGDQLSLYNELKIWDGITIFLKNTNNYEVFTLAFDKNIHDRKMEHNFYLKNIHIILDFVRMFKKYVETSALIDDNDLTQRGVIDGTIDHTQNMIDIAFDKFINSISLIDRLRIKNMMGKYVRLSKRETECVNLLTKCKTMKQIAISLNISPRTAETHILSVKQKLGVQYKNELIDILEMNKFL